MKVRKAKKSYAKRVIHVEWKHQTFLDSDLELREKIVTRINYGYDYTFEEVKRILTEAFTSDSAKFCFDTCSQLQIAYGEKCRAINSFKIPNLFGIFVRNGKRLIIFIVKPYAT